MDCLPTLGIPSNDKIRLQWTWNHYPDPGPGATVALALKQLSIQTSTKLPLTSDLHSEQMTATAKDSEPVDIIALAEGVYISKPRHLVEEVSSSRVPAPTYAPF
jgi:hypothetical protein